MNLDEFTETIEDGKESDFLPVTSKDDWGTTRYFLDGKPLIGGNSVYVRFADDSIDLRMLIPRLCSTGWSESSGASTHTHKLFVQENCRGHQVFIPVEDLLFRRSKPRFRR